MEITYFIDDDIISLPPSVDIIEECIEQFYLGWIQISIVLHQKNQYIQVPMLKGINSIVNEVGDTVIILFLCMKNYCFKHTRMVSMDIGWVGNRDKGVFLST